MTTDTQNLGAPANPNRRFGFIAVIGAPNAGKSTLVNTLVGAKVTIVSHKVQTTRMPIRGIAMDGVSQMVENLQQSGEPAKEWGQEKISNLTNYTQRSLGENPLLFGGLALAVGAGLGMLLPSTHYEDQLLGDLREQTFQDAQGKVEKVKEQAKAVFAEIRPDIEKAATTAATTVVKNVEEAGKQALGEVQQSLQGAKEKLETPRTVPRQVRPREQPSGQCESFAASRIIQNRPKRADCILQYYFARVAIAHGVVLG